MQATRKQCTAEGCTNTAKQLKRGLCSPCATKAGLYPPLPQCAEPGCLRKARSTGKGSRCRHHGGPRQKEAREVNAPSPCGSPHCRNKAIKDGLCGFHQEHVGSPRKRCITEGCTNTRELAGGFCRRCWNKVKEQMSTCGYPLCDMPTLNRHCPMHDIGIDFAAGDWFDWVAAERLFQGRQGDRKPTVPELREALRMADRRHLPHAELGRRIGVDDNVFQAWRDALSRLEKEGVAA